MSNIVQNTSQVTLDVGGDPVVFPSNTVDLEIIGPTVVKSVDPAFTTIGGTVYFCSVVTNTSDTTTLLNVEFSDVLDPMLHLCAGQFFVDNAPATPTVNGQQILYTIPTIAPNTFVQICFQVTVSET
ncbi:MAG: hypothetical protein FWD76_05835 [Firmicutes bacterium]|nr:hypothetical protein [Bacillota bacterium]